MGQPANPGSRGKMAVKTACVCVCVCVCVCGKKRIKNIQFKLQTRLLCNSNIHEQSSSRPTHKSMHQCIVQSGVTTQTTNNSMQ